MSVTLADYAGVFYCYFVSPLNDHFGFHYFREYKRAGQSYENNRLEREAFDFEAQFASEGLEVTPSPSFGYFADEGATFYTDGQAFCGFLSPAHYQIHRFGQDSIPRLGNRSRWELGSDGGACSVASGYFAYNNATHYSLGNGQYCSFFAGDAYERHRSKRPQEPRFGLLESDPEGFMTWTGGCSE
jgi:hypothetical protein